MPNPDRDPTRDPARGPTLHARAAQRLSPLRRLSPWLIVPAAIVAGLLLFVVVWLVQREPVDADSAANTQAPSAQMPSEPTLPAPQVPESMSEDADDGNDDDGSAGIFTLPPAPAQPPPGIAGELPAPAPPGMDEATADNHPSPAADAGNVGPRPVHRPNPTYPRSALRRGLSGEVLVRAMVGVDGRPRQVEVVRSSSHRSLDQAALRAVRGWRFQPAMQDGQPVVAPVEIPVSFNP